MGGHFQTRFTSHHRPDAKNKMDTTKKETFKPTSPLSTDANISTKHHQTQFNNTVRCSFTKITVTDPSNARWFSTHKSIHVVHHVNKKRKGKNHLIVSTHTEQDSTKPRVHAWTPRRPSGGQAAFQCAWCGFRSRRGK